MTTAPGGAPVVAVVTIPDENHFALLHPLVAGLVRAGAVVHVLTDRRNEASALHAGASFVDLYGRYSLEEADDESVPLPSRFVTFAARYGDAIAEEVASLGASLVVHDQFAVVGRVVASALGLRAVAVSPGHDLDPRRLVVELRDDPRVSTAPRCLEAVQVLRDRYGLRDASPFSYVTGLSPTLNVRLEPAAFLTPAERRTFAPSVFYGSLPLDGLPPATGVGRDGTGSFGDATGRLRVYVSFGTIVWRYFEQQVVAALETIVDVLAGRGDVEALIGLGGARVADEKLDALRRPHVTVARWVDQWRVLPEADVFVTHQGLASTHEAIFHKVPMLSVPIFWDQPQLAARCRELGLATPIVERTRGPVDRERLQAAIDELAGDRERASVAFERARQWEVDTLAARGSVDRRILAHATRGAHTLRR